MELTVEVVAASEPGPSAGLPVIVQIRDAGLQDVAATTLAEARVTSQQARAGEPFARAHMSFDDSVRSAVVWVHVDADDSGDISRGDYITMQSYPVREGGSMRVEVKRV